MSADLGTPEGYAAERSARTARRAARRAVIRRSHPARQRVMSLTSEQEIEVMTEAMRACHQRYATLPVETVEDRTRTLGYELALRDLAAQIDERRRAMLRRLNGG